MLTEMPDCRWYLRLKLTSVYSQPVQISTPKLEHDASLSVCAQYLRSKLLLKLWQSEQVEIDYQNSWKWGRSSVLVQCSFCGWIALFLLLVSTSKRGTPSKKGENQALILDTVWQSTKVPMTMIDAIAGELIFGPKTPTRIFSSLLY